MVLPQIPPFFGRGRGKVRVLVFASLLGLSVALPSTSTAQAPRKPFSKHEIIELLGTDLPPDQVEAAVRRNGISFRITSEVESELREAGASGSLIQTLKELAPKTGGKPEVESPPVTPPAAPPVLMVESSPGGAAVYVDDEPKGTTSSEGRLKLTQLTPGTHAVRVSLSGYSDFEDHVELAGGQTVVLPVRLNAAQPSAPPASTPQTGVTPTNLTGFYTGSVENLTANLRAKVKTALIERNGRIGGCMTVARPLVGSGRISGHVEGASVSFTVSGQGSRIEVTGVTSGASLTGTYLAHPSEGGIQQGRFNLERDASRSGPTAADIANCPTEAGEPVATFIVAHDHGSMQTYCVGTLTIGNGAIQFQSSNSAHSFTLALSDVKEVRKNNIYLVAIGAFHITATHGRPANFVVINGQGQYQSPDPVIFAAARAVTEK
jgi:PEGA domain-containing protein